MNILGVNISIDSFVIGLSGISGSGKTTLADLLGDAAVKFTNLKKRDVAVLHLDNFYRTIQDVYDIQGIDGTLPDAIKLVNWDDPRLIDYDRLIKAIKELMENGYTDVPRYVKNDGIYLEGEFDRVYGNKLIILESFLLFAADKVKGRYVQGKKKGELILENPKGKAKQLLEIIDKKIYIETDPDIALDRRLPRDAAMRRHPRYTIAMWKKQVVKAAKKYIYPYVEKSLFDLSYNNTLFSASGLDDFIYQILPKDKFKSKYLSKNRRELWIKEWYLTKRENEVLPIYKLALEAKA